MKRTQILLDEPTYELLRRKAFERGVSLSALLREVLREHLRPDHGKHSLKDFQFIASGHSEQGDLAPVSERHDEALEEDFAR